MAACSASSPEGQVSIRHPMLPPSLPTFYSFLQGRIPGYLDKLEPFRVRPAVWLRREGCFRIGKRDHHLPLETLDFGNDIDGAIEGVKHNAAKNEGPGRRQGSAGRTRISGRSVGPKESRSCWPATGVWNDPDRLDARTGLRGFRRPEARDQRPWPEESRHVCWRQVARRVSRRAGAATETGGDRSRSTRMMSGPWGDGGLGDATPRELGIVGLDGDVEDADTAIVGHGVFAGKKSSLTASGQTRATGGKWPLAIT